MDALTVPGKLDSLTTIRSFTDRVADTAGLDRKAAYRLRLAVDEIATNIVNYGYDRSNLAGDIRVEAHLDPDWLTVSLVDTGAEYDPTAAPPPDDLDQPLENREIGGLGIYLTLKGVDEFRYERSDGRNVNMFWMRRPGAPLAQGAP